MDNYLNISRRKNRKLYIHKEFRNKDFEQYLLSGEKELRHLFQLTTIPSSQFTRVYKLTVNFNGSEEHLYLKRYFSRSFLDSIKHTFRASRAKRAFDASLLLQQYGFGVAEAIGLHEERFGTFVRNNVLITREIEDAKPIAEVFEEICESRDTNLLKRKRDLLRSFGNTIGRLHRKGFFHGDLRLGNVLAKHDNGGWRFSFLDNERTKQYGKLPERLQIKNLVQINLFRGELTNSDRIGFFREYQSMLNKNINNGKDLVRKVVGKTEQRMHKKRSPYNKMRKYFRTNQKYHCLRTKGYRGMFDRVFYEESPISQFIQGIDLLMDDGEILKDGNNTYVSRFCWNSKDIVVKRYNYRGFVNSLRHMVKGSRAKRCWGNAHRLVALNAATPKPVAYFEKQRSGILWKSYLVTEYVAGQNLHTFLRDNNVTEQQRSAIIEQIKEVISKLSSHRITHGDLKHTNILITSNGPVLTDLDAMKVHRLSQTYKFRQQKDITIFIKKTLPHLSEKAHFKSTLSGHKKQ